MSDANIPSYYFGIRRVMIFIDGGHIRTNLKSWFGSDNFDYLAFVTFLTRETPKELKIENFFLELVRVYYYDGLPEDSDSTYLERVEYSNAIKEIPGFEVRLGKLKKIDEEYKQKGVDGLIAIDMLSKAYEDHYDIAILITGDEDIHPIVRSVKDTGKRVFGVFFDKHFSADLEKDFDTRYVLTKDWISAFRQGSRKVET